MIQKSKTMAIYLYRHHFIRYLFVGGTTFIIDIGLLYSLHSKLKIGLTLATSLGYWVSVIYNFLLNRSWTFSQRERSDLRKHLLSYCVLLGFNYLFTVIFVAMVSHETNYLIAKALAVMVQMTWTYVIYKRLIFKDKAQ
jgi:putative flippase GtrA